MSDGKMILEDEELQQARKCIEAWERSETTLLAVAGWVPALLDTIEHYKAEYELACQTKDEHRRDLQVAINRNKELYAKHAEERKKLLMKIEVLDDELRAQGEQS